MSNFFYDSECELETLVEGKNFRKIRAHNGSVMMAECYFENGATGEPHTHVHEQTAYCLEGSFEFTVGDEKKLISEGDSVYMPSNVLHGCKLLSERGRLLDVFVPQREDFLK